MGLILGHSWTAAAIVFLVVASTDWFDGRLARRWNVSSRLGSFLDTTADKLLVTGVLLALVAVGRASPWLSMAIIGRELSLLGLRAAVAAQGLHLEPSMLGKWKATAQFAALALVMLRPDVTIAGAFLDQWLLGARGARDGVVGHRLLRALLLRTAQPIRDAGLRHRRQRLRRPRARASAWCRGVTKWWRWRVRRSPEAVRGLAELASRGAICSTRTRSAPRWTAARSPSTWLG